MKTCFQNLPRFIVIVASTALFASTTIAQQDGQAEQGDVKIEIVDLDGKESNQIIRSFPNQDPQTGISIQNKDGKIVIVDEEGNKRVIDVQDAKRVTVNQEVRSTEKDGKSGTQVFSKAIIIGPDGERQEIVLGDPIAGSSNWQGVFQADRVDNQFMIGVHCQPVSDSLQAQLKLESGAGLVVVSTVPSSAAAKAGIQKHDILMTADDQQLSNQKDLIDAVQVAGKEESDVSMTIIRGGKEISVQVRPVKRPEPQPGSVDLLPEMLHVFPEMKGRNFNFKFKKIEPGVIFDTESDMELSEKIQERLEVQMEQLQKQMEQFREQTDQLRKQLEEQQNDKRDN